MKPIITHDQKDRVIANIIVAAVSVGLLAVLFYASNIWRLVTNFFAIISPFILGGALAFLQIPMVRRIEWLLNKLIFRRKPHPRLVRVLSALLSLLILLVFIAGFLSILVPQVIESFKSLGSFVYTFANENAARFNALLEQYELLDFLQFEGEELVIAWENVLSTLTNYTDFIYRNISAITGTLYTTVLKIFVGLITAIYILLDKERFAAQAKKICYALMQKDNCETLIYWMRRTNRVFASFISGKIVDSIIMGVLCYFGMLIFHLEYPLLISVVVGVTNIIPFFGPFIGAIPSILILLIVNPYSALWFTIFIIVLQQIDGNVIGPLILGDSVGITPLWIMLSIVVGSSLLGLAGMLISVPVFAVLYALVKSIFENRLRKRGLPTESSAYITAPETLQTPGSTSSQASVQDMPRSAFITKLKSLKKK